MQYITEPVQYKDITSTLTFPSQLHMSAKMVLNVIATFIISKPLGPCKRTARIPKAPHVLQSMATPLLDFKIGPPSIAWA